MFSSMTECSSAATDTGRFTRPTNPTFWWGNFLLFDEPPGAGDGERWEALFEAEYSARSEVTHRTFAWDRTDGASGDAEREFVERGYELERTAGLIAAPERIVSHTRANTDVTVRALDPRPGAEADLWEPGASTPDVAGARGHRRRLSPDISAAPPSGAAKAVRGGSWRLVRGAAGGGGRQLTRASS